MKEYKIYCAGKFITTENPLDVENPFSQKAFAQTYLASKENLEKAIEKAQEVQDEMKNMSSLRKYEALSYISKSLKEQLDYFAEILALESGKPIMYSKGEILRSVETFKIAAEDISVWKFENIKHP